ncbi:MAG: DUF5606 domain-containing protein [Bacteroidales bacterium]
MDLTGILSISGHGGLFKLIKQSKSGFIVESLVDQKRMQAFASSKISTLEDIAIFTETGEVHLKKVLRTIFEKENGKPLILNAKSKNEEFKTFFEGILPDYDKEKVYVSDIRKIVIWYNLLVDKGLIDLEEEKEEKEEAEKQEEEKVELKEESTEKGTEKKERKKSTKKAKD